jgi:hypothetical protein
MSTSRSKIKRKDLLRFLEGHQNANVLIKAEKRKRILQLTDQDSLSEYDSLCKVWESDPIKEGIEKLEEQRISFLLKRRTLLNKAGGFGKIK